MPIGSPRVSLVNSILGDWKNWKKIHRIQGFPSLDTVGKKTSLTLESISMRDLRENFSKKSGNFRSKSCDLSSNSSFRRGKKEKERIEKFTCIGKNKIDAVKQ